MRSSSIAALCGVRLLSARSSVEIIARGSASTSLSPRTKEVPVDRNTGAVGDVFAISRPVTPTAGCLWCNGLILPGRLQEEVATSAERAAQRYVDEPYVVAPSVITLNATAASQAANDFLFSITGLTEPDAGAAFCRFRPRQREMWLDNPRRDPACLECGIGSRSRYARGDGAALPTRPSC
jgi:hypothetical protein